MKRVRTELPLVSPSTVYRTLDLVVDERLLLRTDLGSGHGEPAREHSHHRLICEPCRVAHDNDEAVGDLPDLIENASGGRLGDRELSLEGLCPACRATAAPASSVAV